MNAQKLDWNDIPFVLAVCETGTLSAAARKLHVNHSTVFRRIEKVEAKLGVALFERLSHGYVMTSAGEQFFRNALVLDEGVTRIQREISGNDLLLEGTLTITMTDSLLNRLTPIIMAFQEEYAKVELQLLTGTRSLDLMRGDADIALRPTLHPPDHWIGRNLLPISYAVYAHMDYVEKTKNLSSSKYRWIRLVEELNQSPMNVITAQHKKIESSLTITSSLTGLYDLVCAGLGVAVLPCYMGEKNDELVRLVEPDEKYQSNLWILTHPEIRRSAKIHTFFEFATRKIRETCVDFYQ